MGLIVLLAAAPDAPAQFTYLDATSGGGGNTTLADGSTFTPPLNGTTGLDNDWEERTVFGSSGNVFESGGEGAAVTENAPELRTTISGLVSGTTYRVYVLFWDPTSTGEDWSIRAGFTSNPGSNTLYSAADATGELGGATAAVLASSLTYSTAPTIFSEGGRALLAGLIGTTNAGGGGNIQVYLDDGPAMTSVNLRTWYDGLAYEEVIDPLVGPTIITPPTVPVGGSAQATASVSGTAPFHFQWLSNGIPVLNATNQVLALTNLQLANSGAGYSLVVSNNPAGTPTVVTNTAATLTVRTPLNLVWTGAGDFLTWDKITANWTGDASVFTDADNVRFDQNGLAFFIEIVQPVFPNLVTVSNGTGADYEFTTFSTPGGFIGGSGRLVKQGANTLFLDVDSSHNGGTLIAGGTLHVGGTVLSGRGSIGTGAVTNNGALVINRTGSFSIPGVVSGSGGITLSNGNVTLSAENTYSGTNELHGGTLFAANSSALGTSPTVIMTSLTGGANGGTRLDLSGGVTLAKNITMTTSLSPDFRCTLNGSGSGGTTNSYNGNITANGDGRVQVRNDSGTTLIVNGNVTGASLERLLLRGGGASQGIYSGTITLGTLSILHIADGSTWTITSTGHTYGTNFLSNESKLVLGVHNALPTGSALMAEGVGNPRNQLLDLNGFNQTLADLNVNAITITNRSASADSTLTYNGAGASVFTGVIGAGARKVNLSVAAGTLVLSNAAALNIPNSAVSVSAGAVLQLDFDGTNTVAALVLNGLDQAPGLYNAGNSGGLIAGTGNLLVSPPVATPPVISSVAALGGNLIFSGTNGQAGVGFSVLSTTNAADPLPWPLFSSGTFDGSGNFSVTNAITPGEANRFFIISIP